MRRKYWQAGVVAVAAAMSARHDRNVGRVGRDEERIDEGEIDLRRQRHWNRGRSGPETRRARSQTCWCQSSTRRTRTLKIVLHLTSPNDDTSQLAAAIRAGDPPDLVGLNDIDVPEFEHEGALYNVTKYVNELSFKKALSPGHLALQTIGNQYYGVPYLSDLSVLWYNKALFKKAGISGPPTTFAAIAVRRQEDHST